ncbi:hypothetical protein BDZ94DRAFT_1206243 [Collybia nuda]|uniref:Chromatin modification-related protein n=1 Tax=Collybia nuda TaxID=64659 RepID=A0A9P5YJ72_9AGAR|nr:hypothetical protein BDZ94DRAFT_1206243 [Collybia nuda]
MAPARASVNANPTNRQIVTANTLALLADYTHTLDALPLELSRNFADLRELDAVLSASMASITEKILALTQMLEQGTNRKEERLWLLTEIAEDAGRLKLGDEDKIRVACQAADSLRMNKAHLIALSQEIPGFDPASLNRKTTYPHVAARSYMPAVSLEGGRGRRGGYGSLLVSISDRSPAKRKRVPRDDDLEVSHMRSPKKDRSGEATNSRSRARAKKTDRAPSPSESIVSVTSHIIPPPAQNNASGSRNAGNGTTSRGNGSISAPVNKRARSSANNVNNRVATPQPNERYDSPHDVGPGHPNGNGHVNTNSRRDNYHVPPSSVHPSLPISYQPPNGTANGRRAHSGTPYDIHTIPQTLSMAPDWNPPLTQQLEGPGMPVARGQSIHPVHPIIPVAPVGATIPPDGEGADGDGDGDDRTYCFCDGVSYGEMIACDDAQCEREWFHLACIGLTVPPDGRWFCETCRNKRNAKRAGRGGKRRTAGSRAGGRAG